MKTWTVVLAASLMLLAGIPLQAEDGGAGGRQSDLGVYHTYDEMVSDLQNLTAAHPAITKLFSLGRTYENRTIWAVKVSDNVNVDEAEPNITILGGIHARELIGVEVALYILHSLVENYSTNSTIRWFVNGAQLWFVPMINPDGHVWVEKGNDWRKNRSPNPDGTFGVDLNRNFGHLWGLEASHNPPDEDYCGPYAFSENETQAVSGLVIDHPPLITVSYHSFGPYILYPWGNTINQEPVDPRLPEIAENMSLAMPVIDRYPPMMAWEMYPATGDTDDYFYANLSILPFTIELASAYRPPDDQVGGICADNYGPVLYLLNYTVGAPPPPPPRRSIALDGPGSFQGAPSDEVALDFTLINTGEATENVSFNTSCNVTNWTLAVSPALVRLPPGNSTTVTLLIDIPEASPASELVSVRLDAGSDSGANASATANGTVDTVHEVNLAVFGPSVVSSGDNVTLNLTVENRGNAPETLTLSAATDSGWTITQFPDPFEIDAFTASNTYVKVQVPATPLLGGSVANIDLSISNSDGTFHYSQNYTLTVGKIHKVTVTATVQNIAFTEGRPLIVPLLISNLGNVPENGTLDLSGNTAYATLQSTNVSLAPFSNQTVDLVLDGNNGNWSVVVSLLSDPQLGRPRAEVDFEITARPSNDHGLALLFVLVIVIGAIAIATVAAVVLVRRRRRARITDEDPARKGSG